MPVDPEVRLLVKRVPSGWSDRTDASSCPTPAEARAATATGAWAAGRVLSRRGSGAARVDRASRALDVARSSADQYCERQRCT
jgi:hypothetical protein